MSRSVVNHIYNIYRIQWIKIYPVLRNALNNSKYKTIKPIFSNFHWIVPSFWWSTLPTTRRAARFGCRCTTFTVESSRTTSSGSSSSVRTESKIIQLDSVLQISKNIPPSVSEEDIIPFERPILYFYVKFKVTHWSPNVSEFQKNVRKSSFFLFLSQSNSSQD